MIAYHRFLLPRGSSKVATLSAVVPRRGTQIQTNLWSLFEARKYSISSLADETRQVLLHVDNGPVFDNRPEESVTPSIPGIAIVTLNRTTAANALSSKLMQQLQEILQYLNTEPSIRCTILHSSSPKVFCAGADLKERSNMSQEEAVECVDTLRNTFEDIANLTMPTLSAIEVSSNRQGIIEKSFSIQRNYLQLTRTNHVTDAIYLYVTAC